MIRRLANPVSLQTQPNGWSCVATCVAMALGLPVDELGLDLSRTISVESFGVWLAERGIWMRPCVWNGRHGERILNGSLWLVAVRSKNNIGSDHLVLVDTRQPRKPGEDEFDRQHWVLYEPNTGRDGIKVWDWVDEYYATAFWELRERWQPGSRLECERPIQVETSATAE